MLLIVMKVELEEMCYLWVLVFMEIYVRMPIILNNSRHCKQIVLKENLAFIWGYSSVVELPTADRRVPSSNLVAHYIICFKI